MGGEPGWGGGTSVLTQVGNDGFYGRNGDGEGGRSGQVLRHRNLIGIRTRRMRDKGESQGEPGSWLRYPGAADAEGTGGN